MRELIFRSKICNVLLNILIIYNLRPIDITIPHIEKNIKIEFGTTLNKHPCIASFGIDDVMIFVK